MPTETATFYRERIKNSNLPWPVVIIQIPFRTCIFVIFLPILYAQLHHLISSFPNKTISLWLLLLYYISKNYVSTPFQGIVFSFTSSVTAFCYIMA